MSAAEQVSAAKQAARKRPGEVHRWASRSRARRPCLATGGVRAGTVAPTPRGRTLRSRTAAASVRCRVPLPLPTDRPGRVRRRPSAARRRAVRVPMSGPSACSPISGRPPTPEATVTTERTRRDGIPRTRMPLRTCCATATRGCPARSSRLTKSGPDPQGRGASVGRTSRTSRLSAHPDPRMSSATRG